MVEEPKQRKKNHVVIENKTLLGQFWGGVLIYGWYKSTPGNASPALVCLKAFLKILVTS